MLDVVGKRLKEIRLMRRLTLREVGEATGISYSGLAYIERGKRSANSETIKILADYYKVSTDYILGVTEDMNNSVSTNDIEAAFFDEFKGMSPEDKQRILKKVVDGLTEK